MKKRYLSLLLSLIMVLGMVPPFSLPAFAEETVFDKEEGMYVYTNDFEGEDALDAFINPNYDDWCIGDQISEIKYEDEDYGNVWSLGKGGGWDAYLKHFDAEYNNVILEFDMKADSIAENASPFVQLKSTMDSSGYKIVLYDEKVSLGENSDNFSRVSPRGTDWHKYRIECVGTKLTVFRDGEQVFQYKNIDPRRSGGFSFAGWRNTVLIDNLTATFSDLPIKQYTNDFEGEDALDAFINPNYDDWCIGDQKSEIKYEDEDYGNVWSLGKGGGWDAYLKHFDAEYNNMILEFDMKADSIAENASPFVQLKSTMGSSGYKIVLYNEKVSLGEGTLDFSPVSPRGTDWHKYRIECVGRKLTVFRDGEQVFQYKDIDPSRSGGFSFAGWRNTVLIDNLTATFSDLPIQQYKNDFEGENALDALITPNHDSGYTGDQKSEIKYEDEDYGKVWSLGQGGGWGAYRKHFDAAYNDVILEFDMKADTINDGDSPFVILKSAMNEEGYKIVLYNEKVSLGENSDIFSPVSPRGTDWHKYRIECIGSKLTVFRDGEQVFQYKDVDPDKLGGFSFAGWRNTVLIDNLTATFIGGVDDAGMVDFVLNHNELTLSAGDFGSLSPIYEKLSNKQGTSYASGDEDVVEVNEYGVVKAIASGTATITATADDGATATCDVTVIGECNTFYYVATNGNDSTGDGTVGNPFATLEKARDTIRGLAELPAGGITVYLREGEYYVNETIVFTPEDSGEKGKPIVYSSYTGEKATVHSGKNITGFTRMTDNYPQGLPEVAHNRIFVADIEPGWRFHDLYVNGERQQVARQFNSNDWAEWGKLDDDRAAINNNTSTRCPVEQREKRIEDGLPIDRGMEVSFKPGLLEDLPNNGDLEMYLLPVEWWNSLPVIRNIDTENNTATLESFNPAVAPHYDPYWGGGLFQHQGHYNMMNAPKFLDAPGEWCVDSENGKVYWWPKNTNYLDEAIAPYLYELIRLQGDEEDANWEEKVSYIEFRNLNFMYVDRLPEDEWWTVNKDAPELLVRNAENPFGAIFMQGAENCAVIDSSIMFTGAYAVTLDHYAQNNRVVHNELGNLGCGGVNLAGYGPGTTDLNKYNMVLGNNVYDIGLAPYQHSSAVTIYGSGYNDIKFNNIERTPYTAIMLTGADATSINPNSFDARAYSDTYGNKNTQYAIRRGDIEAIDPDISSTFSINNRGITALPYQNSDHNIIEYNTAYDYMLDMNDGGCYYAWGSGLNNEYNFNIAKKVTPAKGGCYPLYMDDYAQSMKLEGNRVWAKQLLFSDKSGGSNIFKSNEMSVEKPDGFDELLATINGVVDSMGGYIKTNYTHPGERAPVIQNITVESCSTSDDKTTIIMPELPAGANAFVITSTGSEVEAPWIGESIAATRVLLPEAANDIPAISGKRFAIYAVDEFGGAVAYANIVAIAVKQPTVLYEEDFETDAALSWIVKKWGGNGPPTLIDAGDDNRAWHIKAGEETMTFNDGDPAWRNYIVEMEVYFNKWDKIRDYAGGAYDNITLMGRRANSSAGSDRWEFIFRKSGKLELNKFHSNQGHEVIYEPFDLTPETWYKMMMEFDGDTINGYIAEKGQEYGEPIISYTDTGSVGPKLDFGGIGFGTLDGNFYLDNLYVYGIEDTSSMTINNVRRPQEVFVPLGTEFNEIDLPETVTVDLFEGGPRTLPVVWSNAGYDKDTLGTYPLSGDITLSGGISNIDNLKAEISVTVQPHATVSATPVIKTNLASTKSLMVGETLTLTVAATSPDGGNLSYAWKKDGIVIPGANTETYKITNVKTTDSGNYQVVVTNKKGTLPQATTDSAICAVTVAIDPNAPVRLELSARTKLLKKGEDTTLTASLYAAGDKLVTGKINWSSGKDSVATVDQTGKIVAVAAGTAKISAQYDNDNSIYSYCLVTVEENVAPTREIKITEPNKTDDTYAISGQLDGSITLTASGDVKWSTGDKNVAKLTSSTKREANIEYKRTGSTIITATGIDERGKATGKVSTVAITVNDIAPKLPVTSLTVYKDSTAGTAFKVLPSDNFSFSGLKKISAIKSGADSIDKFTLTGSGTDWKLGAQTADAGTYKVRLQAITTNESIGFFDLTVKVVATKPKATIKMTALDTFRKRTEGVITITGSNLPEINKITVKGELAENFIIGEKRTDGRFYVTTKTQAPLKLGTNKKPIVNGEVDIEYDGLTVTQPITISIKPVVPKLKLAAASTTINKSKTASASFTLTGLGADTIDSVAKVTPAFAKNSVINDAIVKTGDDSFSVTLANPATALASNPLQLNVMLNGARDPIPVKPTVKTVTADGKFKLSPSTLTFFTDVTGPQVQTVELKPDFAGANITVETITPVGSAPGNIIAKNNTNTGLVVTVPAGMEKATHKYTITTAGDVKEGNTTQTLTVKVDKKKLAATLKAEKGSSINLMDREGTKMVYIPTIKNNMAAITEGEAGVTFKDASGNDFKDSNNVKKLIAKVVDGKIEIQANPKAKIKKGESFRGIMTLNLAGNNTATTGTITIKTTQSKVTHSIPKSTTMYQSRSVSDSVIYEAVIDLWPANPNGAKVDTLTFKEEKTGKVGTSNPNEAYGYYFDKATQTLHIWIEDSSRAKLGKSNLTFSVTYEGQGEETFKDINREQKTDVPKPIDIKIPVNVL